MFKKWVINPFNIKSFTTSTNIYQLIIYRKLHFNYDINLLHNLIILIPNDINVINEDHLNSNH